MININKLFAYNFVITSIPHEGMTRITFSDGTVENYDWTGEINQQTMIESGLFNGNTWQWIKEPEIVNIGTNVTGVGYGAFYKATSIIEITIPSSVKSIGNQSFRECSKLQNLIIPDSVTSIGSSSVQDCRNLTNVIVGNGVTDIGSYAFYNCTKLQSATIGNSVSNLGNYAFLYCRGMNSVTFHSFTKSEIMELTTSNNIFGYVFYDDSWKIIEKTFTAICTDGSMTIHFSAENPATITFTDL